MTTRSTLAKAVLGLATGAATLTGLATPAAAQSAYDGRAYDSRGGYDYDGCQREKTNRGVAGALIGGALGAVFGSNAASHGVRTEGSLLGGAVGAGVGAAVGSSSAACDGGYRSSYDRGDRYAGGYEDRGYYDAGPAQGYDERRPYETRFNYGYAYDHYGRGYRPAGRPDRDGCTNAESPIYLPDGRVEQRLVRVCQDSRGEYQVVD